jgi:hypothetical protein
LGAGLRQSLAQPARDLGRLLVEGEDGEFHEQFKAVLELLVAVNLFGAAGFL